MTYIDTADMDASGFVSTIPAMPAEACTEIGADQGHDSAAPEGAAIAVMVVVLLLLLVAGLIHTLAVVLARPI